MKRLILLPCVLLLCAGPALAQQGTIGLYQDTGGSFCELNAVPGTTLNVFVVHIATVGAKAVQFKVIQEAGASLLWLADAPLVGIIIGDTQTGAAVAFGSCRVGPNAFLRIDYFVGSPQPSCSRLRVVPDPLACTPGLLAVDCAPIPLTAAQPVNGGTLVINPDASCPCNVVPTEESSWGQIKSLFD